MRDKGEQILAGFFGQFSFPSNVFRLVIVPVFLQHPHGDAGEFLKIGNFVLCEGGSGNGINDAERSQPESHLRNQGRAGIETDVRFTCYEGVVVESRILGRIQNDQRFRRQNGVGAERNVA